MTTISFYQGKLHGDRMHVTFTSPMRREIGESKLYTSLDRQLIYGKTGLNVAPEDRKRVESDIRCLFEAMLSANKNGRVFLSADGFRGYCPFIVQCYPHSEFIVANSDGVAFSIKPFGDEWVIHGVMDCPAAVGTGGWYLKGILAANPKTIEEAYAVLHTLDPVTSAEVTTLDPSKLKPFVIKGERTSRNAARFRAALSQINEDI